MAARCSFLSTPVAFPSVPSGIALGPQISLLPPTTICVIEPESPRNPYPVEEHLIGMDFLPHLRVTEHPIGSPPASACPIASGNYIASRLPFLEDATANAVTPLSPLPTPPPPPSPSSQHDRIPRACHGVERRQRSRPSSRGGADYLHFSKLTRDERAALKTAPSRRVAFAEHAHQIASSSLWTSPDDAPPATPVLATATGKLKSRPPTPGRATRFFDAASVSFGGDERDESPGFDADVEIEPAEVARRDSEQIGDKERLTIIVPGGKSEAYVAMAFERSCSLGADDMMVAMMTATATPAARSTTTACRRMRRRDSRSGSQCRTRSSCSRCDWPAPAAFRTRRELMKNEIEIGIGIIRI
ncbi:hypothetical protein BJV77DRAFT_964596 [Russula vinacea]|nr:hypothetical protein BJV77DRAFT_964596 [Russula vinacea]